MSSKVPPHPTLPTGTVTFLFTDIEGSTTLWEQFPDAMHDAIARHDRLLQHAIESSGGRIVKSTGDGVYAVFAAAAHALGASLAAQRALQACEGDASNSTRRSPIRYRRSHSECGWACTLGSRKSATATTSVRR